jgi:hypothetical protein
MNVSHGLSDQDKDGLSQRVSKHKSTQCIQRDRKAAIPHLVPLGVHRLAISPRDWLPLVSNGLPHGSDITKV